MAREFRAHVRLCSGPAEIERSMASAMAWGEPTPNSWPFHAVQNDLTATENVGGERRPSHRCCLEKRAWHAFAIGWQDHPIGGDDEGAHVLGVAGMGQQPLPDSAVQFLFRNGVRVCRAKLSH